MMPLPHPGAMEGALSAALIQRSAWEEDSANFDLGGLGSQCWSPPKVALGTLGSKNIRTGEAPPVKSGDRQPEQQTPVVP